MAKKKTTIEREPNKLTDKEFSPYRGWVLTQKEVSTRILQLQFSMGSNLAEWIMVRLENENCISKNNRLENATVLNSLNVTIVEREQPKKKKESKVKPTQATAPLIEQAEISYFQQRVCIDLGATPETNRIKLKYYEAESNTTNEVEYEIFSEDSAGNIKITPFTINRELIQYDNPKATPTARNVENARNKVFYITRLKTPEEYKDKDGNTQVKKYDLPKGAGTAPFFSPGLCDKFERKQKIETLILTEGYFKAFKGYLCGLDIVGLSSITHYKQNDTETMYTDVLSIIHDCAVENVIILYDGDARDISLKDLENKKDLRRRPDGFINSARAIRELLKDCKTDIYFASVKSDELEGAPKGLDDLLTAFKDKTKEITSELVSYSRPLNYFYREEIRKDLGKLYKFFKLDNVENFYDMHIDIIDAREFIFNGTTYKRDREKGYCEVMVPGEAKNYFRVGDDYYKFVSIPNKYKQNERKFQRRLKSTIIEDHGKKFTAFTPKYESFCNVPDHVNFQQVFNNCFNVYTPFEHEPEPGECPNIKDFILHIFGDQYELGLDYVQLLYQRPTQVLPILCLVSKANKTGKSTFIKLLKAIFTQNATIIGNEELSNQFNAFWSTKLIVACEESFIEKKTIIERLKALSTGDKITMNAKGRDQIEIDFFAKFILASNNEDTFIFASRDDVRYWVRKVPVFAGKEKVRLLEDMIEEIPAFLDFLNNREMVSKNVTRMWFDEKLLRTEALDKLIHNSRPGIEKELYENLKTIFLEFGEEEILITPTNANELFLTKKQDQSYLIRIFTENMGVKKYANPDGKEVTKNYIIPYWKTDTDGSIVRSEHKYVGRPYVFKAIDILDKYDLKQWEQLNGALPGETVEAPKPIEAKQITIQDEIQKVEAEKQELKKEKINEEDIPF